MPEAKDLYRLHNVRLTGAGRPLHEALTDAVPGMSRQQARRSVQAGLVKIDGTVVSDPHATVPHENADTELDLRQGIRRVWIRAKHGEAVRDADLGILHLDGDLCVVDKPPGIASVPPPRSDRRDRPVAHVGERLRTQLRRLGRETNFIGVVHRLDMDTSGCLVVALTRDAHRILASQFAGEAAVRTYRCVVAGAPLKDADEIRARQGRGEDGRRALVDVDEPGVDAITRYKVLRRFARNAELEVSLGTGRTHQVRVALASIGCPVLGDRVYAKGNPDARASRMMLHAFSLEVDHPRTGSRLRVECPLPTTYLDVVAGLEAAPGKPAR